MNNIALDNKHLLFNTKRLVVSILAIFFITGIFFMEFAVALGSMKNLQLEASIIGTLLWLVIAIWFVIGDTPLVASGHMGTLWSLAVMIIFSTLAIFFQDLTVITNWTNTAEWFVCSALFVYVGIKKLSDGQWLYFNQDEMREKFNEMSIKY